MDNNIDLRNGKMMALLKEGVRCRIPFRMDGILEEIDEQLYRALEGFKATYPDGHFEMDTDNGIIIKDMSEVEMVMMTMNETGRTAIVDFIVN